jgi:hypothetical protein
MNKKTIVYAGLAELRGQGDMPPAKFSRAMIVVVWLMLTPLEVYYC